MPNDSDVYRNWKLSDTQHEQLVDALLDCGAFRDDVAGKIVNALPEDIRLKIGHINRPDLHVQAIINECQTFDGGLERLSEIIAYYERGSRHMSEVYELMHRFHPQPVSLAELANLKAILEAVIPDDKQLVDMVRELGFFQYGRPKSYRVIDQRSTLLAWLGNFGRRSTGDAPIISVAISVRQSASSEETDLHQLTEWIERMVEHLEIHSEDVALTNPPKLVDGRGRKYLSVEIQPYRSSRSKGYRYYFAASKYLADLRYVKISSDDQLRNLMDIVELLPKYIIETIDELPNPGALLVIEFFLPRHLMTSDVDHWKLKGGDEVGVAYPVVVRSLERLQNLETWEKWHSRWDSANLNKCAHEISHAWDTPFDANTWRRLRIKLDEYACVALPFVPPNETLIDEDLIEVMIRAGAAIALWTRGDEDGSTFDVVYDEMQRILNRTPLGTLPEKVWERRKQAWAESTQTVWRRVTLLWDDPTRKPPTVRRHAAPSATGGGN